MLELYTIYDRPADHPSSVVLRRWIVDGRGTQPAESALCNTIDEARAILIAHGLVCIPRDVNDDPVVVETWV